MRAKRCCSDSRCMGFLDWVSIQTKAPATRRMVAGTRMVHFERGPHRVMWPTVLTNLATQKQSAVLIECLAENDPGLAQILVYLRFAHSHRLSDRPRVEDWSSAPLPFPSIRVARCSKSVFLEHIIGTKRTNALKRCPHRRPELWKGCHLVKQFPSDNLVL